MEQAEVRLASDLAGSRGQSGQANASGDALPGGRLRLSTLVRLRWLAIAGQTTALLIVHFWFSLPLPFFASLALVILSALVNVSLTRHFVADRRLDAVSATGVLGYDILQLAGLLYLTGGLENPFAILLLVPVIVAATALEPDKTFLLGGLALICASILALRHLPLPWPIDEALDVPHLYVGGVWVALVCALVFMAIYTQRVSRDARQLADALTATDLVLQREQHLSALDGLAAAAHELGTPLATIALVTKELEAELGSDPDHGEDIRLLRSQSQRCREILAKLTSLSAEGDSHLGPMSLSHVLEDVAAPHRDFGIALVVQASGVGPEPVSRRNPGLLHGLGNIVENAVDFAQNTVAIDAHWDDTMVRVRISDDGRGFAPDILARIGEPYVTTRRSDGENRRQHGLGLGFFIAKTLLERTGARLAFANRKAKPLPGKAIKGASLATGALVTVIWPRERFEAGADLGQKDSH